MIVNNDVISIGS